MKEEWRDVVGYEGLYQVSNLGRVKSLRRYKGIIGYIKKGYMYAGYSCVQLCAQRKVKSYYIHTLVAEAFIHPRPYGYQIDHIDRDRQNNRPCNLRFVTPSENSRNSRRSDCIKYTGVYYYTKKKKWFAFIGAYGKVKNLGGFISAKQAARAYDDYVIKHNLNRGLNNA